MSLVWVFFFLESHVYAAPTTSVWNDLNSTVGGRLYTATPFSSPCFPDSLDYNESTCLEIQENYTNPSYRASKYSGYSVTQWEGCISTGEQCQLDSTNTSDPSAWMDYKCSQGSIAPHYIEVQSANDVKAAYEFSESTGVPLSIKNSGHDFFGRSTIRGSLALWTHHLKNLTYSGSFVPEGGNSSESFRAITIGAGASWDDVYKFADQNNVTAIGGYHETVGASGGWLMGGGHSVLSPVFGIGVDRVLEIKIVTPDRELRVANAHKNTDLFWALRGGGGGTYGVVLESTSLVEPQMKLQVVSLSFNRTAENAPAFWKLVVNSSLRWGHEGWGGHIRANKMINVTPLLSLDEAKESVKEATDYALSQNGTAVVEELPSWFAFYEKYVLDAESPVGAGRTQGSWLVPADNFTTDEGREAIYQTLLTTLEYVELGITQATPFLYNYTEGATSTTDAWRSSLWHAIFSRNIAWNGTIAEDLEQFNVATNLAANFKSIAPNSGSYFNEGDARELDWKRAYWGDNYPRLLEIKNKYDPYHLLDCNMCVGWKGKDDPEYSCYL